MELVNQSGLPLELTTAFDVAGYQHLLVVAKATYVFDGVGRVSPAKIHHDVAYSDAFVGEPGLSAPRYEADMALRKARCDVLIDATAHAPDQRPRTELEVGVKVGAMTKHLLAVGDRVWQSGALRVTASQPAAFTAMPLHYGRAFGGSVARRRSNGDVEHDTFEANPVGVGYSSDTRAELIDGMPLPNAEHLHERLRSPTDVIKPMSFGPLGRHWLPRRRYAGVYGQAWRDNNSPLLPDDFDELYFQAAPADQQIDFPRGGEQVALQHLVPGHPLVVFALPKPDLQVKVLHASQRVDELDPRVDTVFVEPDKGLLTFVYRASIKLGRRGGFGVRLVAAGPVCDRWWNSKVFGSSDCGCGGNSDEDEPHRPDEPTPSDDAAVESEPAIEDSVLYEL